MTNFAKIIEAEDIQILTYVNMNGTGEFNSLCIKTVLKGNLQLDMEISYDESNPDGAQKTFDTFHESTLPNLLKVIDEQQNLISDKIEDEFVDEIVLEGEFDDEEQDEFNAVICEDEEIVMEEMDEVEDE